MPLQDWKRTSAGLFHHFHQMWTTELARTLNRGMLPDGLSAFVEQKAERNEPDLLAIDYADLQPIDWTASGSAIGLAEPAATIVQRSEQADYVDRSNRVVVRHRLGTVLAFVEIVSPGNKHSRHEMNLFVKKVVEAIRRGVHVTVIDFFPPTARDPEGIHRKIWDEIEDQNFVSPPGRDRTIVSYAARPLQTAYVEPLAVGDEIPDVPLFLTVEPARFVRLPLRATHDLTYDELPAPLRRELETDPGDRID